MNIKPIKIWHILIGGTIGNLTEWYNFLLYGYLASVMSQLFFPLQNKLMSLTLTFTVFALSFLVRPLGGILFGWIGDTYGRQRALIFSLILMAIPTFLIGCLPTYQDIGLSSPVLLLIFRICQGLSAGGEHTGSAVYIAEYAPPDRRALWVSTVPTSAAIGILISSTTSLLILNSFPQDKLLDWGWRMAYWIGSLLCLLSIFIRLTLPETPYFQKIKKNKIQYPLKKLITDIKIFKKLLIIFLLAGSWGIFYQILFIWMPTYLTHIKHFSQTDALQVNSIFMFSFACLLLAMGYFADYFNRKKILISSCVLMFLFAYPAFLMLSADKIWLVYIAMGIFTLIFSMYLPAAFVLMVESFSTEIRYTGFSFGFNIGLAIFGGTCPLIVTWLIEITHNEVSPAFYMMFAACLAFLTTRYVIDKKGELI